MNKRMPFGTRIILRQEEYILAMVDARHASFIELSNGNRFRDGIKLKGRGDLYSGITEELFLEMFSNVDGVYTNDIERIRSQFFGKSEEELLEEILRFKKSSNFIIESTSDLGRHYITVKYPDNSINTFKFERENCTENWKEIFQFKSLFKEF